MNQRSTFDILFYVKRNNPKKDGSLPIMCRITLNGTQATFSCKMTIPPDLWGKGIAKGKTDTAKKVNRDMETIKSNIRSHHKKLLERDSYITAEKVKNAYLGLSMQHETLLQIYGQFNVDFDKLVNAGLRSESTQEKYTTVYKHLKEFIKYRYNLSDIGSKDIAPAFITDFEIFLRAEKMCSHNAIVLYMMPLRKMITIAQKNRFLTFDPFTDYHITMEETARNFLNSEEIRTLMTANCKTGKREFARDMFIFCTFTGLAFVDLFTLSEDDICQSEDGHLWIVKKRVKSDVESVVRLMDLPRQILEKYRGTVENGLIFLIKSYTALKYQIQKFAKECSIEKHVSWHQRRHTIATEICLTNGMPIETLSKMLGHKSIKTTQIYAKVTQKKNSRDMDYLENTLKAVKEFQGVSLA